MIKEKHIIYRQIVAFYFLFAMLIAGAYYMIYGNIFNAMTLFSTISLVFIGVMAIIEELSR